MSGVTEVRLYRNTVDEVPVEYTNVTAAVLNSSTKNHATGVKRYLDGVATADGLSGGTNYFWVELIDARGNTAGPQPVGDVHIRHSLDMKLVEHGIDIVAEGDLVLFNGLSSYVRFADIGEAGVDYGEFVRSGTWSMTFWIKPLVDSSQNIRFLVIRESRFAMFTNNGFLSDRLTNTETDLTNNTWYFFAVSVEDHQWTLHSNADSPTSPTLTAQDLGTWDTSGMPSDYMFIGVNNNGTSGPSSWRPNMWDGYATKVTIDDRPLTGEEATAIYNATTPAD